MLRALVFSLGLFSTAAMADVVQLVEYSQMEIPVTPFSNMASGYQATNFGFRAVLRDESGEFIAGGPMNIDAVIRGHADDASQGSAYGQLVLSVDLVAVYPGIAKGIVSGNFTGLLSICMAKDVDSKIEFTECKSLSGNIHPERPFQWLNKKVDYSVNNGAVHITKYYGDTGEGGTSRQLSLAVFHPAYGFAAPGKAFKDYQSPLVLDLDGNGKLDLVNVWNDATPVRFDLNGSGQKVRTGWVKPTDGLLFWDNGTGCVQNGTEFFGEYSGSKKGEKTFDNGFEALRTKLHAKAAGKIVAAAYPQLKIWRNTAQDGVCKKSEVVPASKLVKEIYLSYQTIENPKLTEDNEIRMTGTFLGRDGKKHVIGDVWFKQRRNEVASSR